MIAYLVRTSDSLWSIAAARPPASSSTASIGSAWRRIWGTNRAVIGPHPDVILPGQKLPLNAALTR